MATMHFIIAGGTLRRECRTASTSAFAGIDVLADDLVAQRRPGLLGLHVEEQVVEDRRGHVVDVDVGLGEKGFEEVSDAAAVCDLAAVVAAAGGPEEEVAAGVV